MSSADMPYFDDVIGNQRERISSGHRAGFWRASHWGLYAETDVLDDAPARYAMAAMAMTGRIVDLARILDGQWVLDVGCGFGGTLDFVAERFPACRLAGVNIDERQLHQAKALLDAEGVALDGSVALVTGDGCRLPVRRASCDHILAIECVFHFPSRKAFFREAARVLRPGGTLTLSDFLLAPGSLTRMAATRERIGTGALTGTSFFGPTALPLTLRGYVRLARAVGMEVVVDEDITAATLPTYPALRRVYREAGLDHGVEAIDGCEQLALNGGWEYHLLSFRKPRHGEGAPPPG
jgi:cyclopropane fatty-acyl-phospholipid synthase-like methyltransferase